MKKLTLVALVTMLATTIFAQNWKFSGTFPDTTGGKVKNSLYFLQRGLHGIAVDPEDKVWISPYYATDSIFCDKANKQVAIQVVYCFDKTGKAASFSPIKTQTNGSVIDTLGGGFVGKAWSGNWGRGLGLDPDGNVLASFFDQVFRIDYKTGLAKGKIKPVAGASGVANCNDGENIFTGHVVGGNPVKVWDKDLNFQKDAIAASKGYSRAFTAAKVNGESYIYHAGYTLHYITIYKYGGAFGSTDSVGYIPGVDCESMTVTNDPETNKKMLWVSAGSTGDAPNRFPGVVTSYSAAAWYGFDITTDPTKPILKDSIKWNGFKASDGKALKPRGIAFSNDYLNAYVIAFENGYSGSLFLQKFQRVIANETVPTTVAKTYSLAQNYPNPFNPSTKISFTMPQSGIATLKVYNMLGQEVATLVNTNLAAGAHTFDFNASNLSSGTYMYQLKAGSVTMTKKMMLVK